MLIVGALLQAIRPAAGPSSNIIKAVNVTKNGNEYEIELESANCGHNNPKFTIPNAEVKPSTIVNCDQQIQLLLTASFLFISNCTYVHQVFIDSCRDNKR